MSGSGWAKLENASAAAGSPWSQVQRALRNVLGVALVSLVCVASLHGQTVLAGTQTLETNLDTNAKGLAEAFPVTAVASGQVGSINFFLDESSTATKIYVGIYSNSSGSPGTLLTQGSTTQLHPGTWNSATVTAASLTSGASYWIAILGTTSGQPYFYDQSTNVCNSQTSSQSNLTSLPSTWTKGKSWSTCYISAYAVTGSFPATVMIGNQYVESYLDKNPAGRAEAFPNIANTTGSVGAIDLYLDPTSGSGPVYVGLYADNGSDHPGTLLGQGNISTPVAGSWNTISITPSSITAGSRYWIAVLGTQATSPYFRDRQTTACHSETTPQSNLTLLPSTWTTGTTWNTCYISAYGLPASSGSPILSISPSTLSFAAIQGGANPTAASLSVTNTGTGTLSFTDSTDQSWLSATPSSGTAPNTLQVSATVGSLTAGTYTGHVTVTASGAQNSPATATVTFTVSPFVPPSISAAASPSPNSNGWNNSTVTVTFTCVAGSYPIATCPSPAQVTTQAANQSICGKAVDTMGNSSAQACATVSLDETPPTITATVSPAPVGGINYGSATVTFTCTDALSGVASCPSPVTDTTIGSNQKISGTATDKAGNSSTTSVTLNIQPVVLPTITATPSPVPNTNGWNNTNVTVTFACTAGTYPIQTCPSPVVVSTQAANQSICGKAVDTMGNSSTQACATVSLDETPPTITATVSPAPVGGINYGSATVTFTCTDALSGVANCPSPVTDTTIGSTPISGTATDKAGNTATASVTVNLQASVLPTITAVPSPAPNSNGWNNTNVTVTFTCTAGSYPIQTCPSPVVVSTEAANQSICGHAVDTMGNSSTTVCDTVNLDKTPPTITAAVSPAPVGGINYGSATVTFTCSDTLSGVASCTSPVTVTTIGSTPVSGTATDKAGNSASTSVTVDIQAVAPPTISAAASPSPNSNGWNDSTVTVTFTCTAGSYPIATCPSPVQVTTQAANQSICGKAVDTMGNSSPQACETVSLDETPPIITATVMPAPVGGINYGTATVTFTCTDALSGIATCPSPVMITTIGSTPVSGTATDKAGNSASTSVTVNIQAVVLPTLSASTSPAPNSAGWNTSNVTVNFICTAGTYPIQSCPSPISVTAQGANQSICGHAVDTQGNSSAQVCDTVNLELTPPTISASASPIANSAGWNNTSVTVSFACTPSVSSITSCSPRQTVSSQGSGQVITGTVQDQAGDQATTSVSLNIDLTPPTIVQFTAPSQLSPGGSGTATVTVTDIAPIASVVFALNGSPVGTVLTPPYAVTVTAPSNSTSGSTLTLTATAMDVAGNVASANAGIQVVSSGVLVGEVISDTTGLPLPGATVQVVGQASQSGTSDSNGRYSIPVSGSQLFVDVSVAGTGTTPAMVTVERQISIQSGVGNVPVDARMTAQATPTSINAGGGTVGSGAITITVPPGGATTSYYLTPLSPQGLPGLLPLGWSPVAAFDLQANISTSAALSANFTGLPTQTLYLVSYSYTIHGWSMVMPNQTASNGALTVSLPSTGDYALAIPDTGTTIPAVGQPLTGVGMVPLPTTATSSGSLSPGNVGPGGGTSMASLAVRSQTSLPSGTAIQAEVTETYTLTSGQLLSEEPRYEDLLIYQNPAPAAGSQAGAIFPVTPSQTFQAAQLTSGDVHLNILSGRESVRGETGGSDPVSVQSGGATLTISAGSLPQDTAINVTSESLDTFLPSTGTLVPLVEYNVDFSGQSLSNAAQLAVGTQGAAPGTNVVIAQIDRIAGVPYLVVVSAAQVTTTGIVSQATPGLPGITQGGDYVFYEVTIPTGFVSGTVSASTGPVAAMVQTDALPFVTFANANGSYDLVAAAGTVNLTASVPNTALTGTGTAQVTSGQTATANLTVVGQVEAVTITPANGAVGIPLTAEIDLIAADAFNPTTVTSSNVLLTAAGNTTPVPVRFVYSAGNTKLAVFPQNALLASTQYTFQASGIANALGGLISVPTISFTTASITVPTYNISALVFGMPDQSGNVSITAPAGSFPAGTTIQIVDLTSGIVLTLMAQNDGSVSGSIPATINDTLQVTLTDSSGNNTTYTISQFVAADGTTAIGPGGGTVVGPGNTGIIIPAGALTQGVTFQLTQLDKTAFPVLPAWTGVNFGSGLRITDPAMPTFKSEAKLAFPVPANAPSNAFYYVFRRLTDQNGNPYFETIDEAFVQGTGASAQVVTASPPFCGYHNSYGNFSIQSGGAPLPVTAIDQDYFVMWDATAGNGPSGIASTGLIVGLATQTVPAVLGVSQATTQPATGTVSIFLTPPPGSTGSPQVAIYDGSCATFTLFDPQLGGGSRNVTATQTTSTGAINMLQATIDEVDGAQSDDGLYAIYAGLEDLYKNIGRVNFLFPAQVPPPPPAAVTIDLYTLNQNGHRVPVTSGILQAGTNIVIAFQSGLQVQSATINGSQLDIETPDSTDGAVLDNLPEQLLQSARVKGPYPLGAPGNYTLTVTAEDPVSGVQSTASQDILVVAAGGSNNTALTCTAAPPPADPTAGCTLPQVVSVSPTNNATGVSTGAFPVITFNEPVTNVPANVVMTGPSGAVPFVLVGDRAPNSPGFNQNPIANPVGPTDIITSLTIEPTDGLSYNATYTITLNATAPSCLDSQGNPMPQPTSTALIVDQNQPPTGPFCLAPYPAAGQQYQFTTFGPQDFGGANSGVELLTRSAVIGNYAYASEYLSSTISGLEMFNLTTPTSPIDLGAGAAFLGRATDTTGQANSPVTGAGLVAVSAGGALDNEIPANVYLYDVSSPTQPTRVGAVSVTPDVAEGIATRLFMLDEYLYASTFEQGLQVIDLGQAISEYSQQYSANPTSVGEALSTAGDGFAMDAITNTIPIPLTTGGQATMFDLKADNFGTVGGGSQVLVVATGQLPFLMADPTLSGSSAILYPPSSTGTFTTNPAPPVLMTVGSTNYLLCYGQALDIGTIATTGNGNSGEQHIAVVVGNGISGPASTTTSCPKTGQVPVLAVMNINQVYTQGTPFTPELVGFLQLSTGSTDVALNGSIALVSTGGNILMVDVSDPSQPVLAGTINGNFGNWVTTNSSGLIVGASNNGNAGIQLSSLGVVPAISADATGLVATPTGTTSADIPITYSIYGLLSGVASAQVNVIDDTGTVVFTTPVPVQPTGSVTWPAGATINVTPATISFQVQNPDGGVSDFTEATAENDSGSAPTPVILSTTPNTIVVNSPQQLITITGKNFLVSTQAEFILEGTSVGGSAPQTLPVTFVSATQVQLTLTSSLLTQVTTAALRLLNGSSLSNDYPMQIVPAGLPPSLTLTSINPSQLPIIDDAQDTTIALTGTNFVVGDTVARVDTEDPNTPPELTSQVTSPTTMQVTIPGYWQATPTLMNLYVQSTQYPMQVSQLLPFQIGSGINYSFIDLSSSTPAVSDPNAPIDIDPNAMQPPNPPILTAVGDGTVSLAASGSTEPISVTLQGSGFEAGSTVVVDIDGLQTPLTPSSISGNQIQVQVPASSFQLRSYTFDLQVNPQGQQQALHAQQHNNVGKVIFRNVPQYRVPGNSYHLGGFHQRSGNVHNPNQPRDYFLMVPEQNSCAAPSAPPCSNAAESVLTGQALSPGAKITFNQDSPALLAVNPPSTQSTVTTVTEYGTNEAQDKLQITNVTANENLTVNGANVQTPVGKLQVQLLQRHHYAVYLHYVTETPTPPNPDTNQDFPCNNLPLPSRRIPQTQQQYDNFVQSLETGLNNIYTQQANVQFDVYGVQGSVANGTGTCDGEVVPEQVHYDLNNDHDLSSDDVPNDEQNALAEQGAIITALQTAHPPQMPPGVTRQFHIFFVKSFLIPLRVKDINYPAVGPQVGTPFTITYTFDGGSAPYNYAYNNNSLPPGLTFSNPTPTSLRISGTPTANGVNRGPYVAFITVTDSSQPALSTMLAVTFQQIVAAPGISPMPLSQPVQGQPNPFSGYTLAFNISLGGSSIFADDRTPDARLIRVLAHELGHGLNMDHASEDPNRDWGNPPHPPPNNTCIPGLPAQDSDYSDQNQLMWFSNIGSKQQLHLGIQQLWQMNGNIGTVQVPGCE